MACNGGYVLIVEDDKGVREALEFTIGEAGHPVKTATDGAAAFAVLQTSAPPSLILLDLMMPGMDGVQFLVQKQRHPTLEGIPVYLMTANGTKSSHLPGIVSVLRKPFNLDDLLTIVENHC